LNQTIEMVAVTRWVRPRCIPLFIVGCGFEIEWVQQKDLPRILNLTHSAKTQAWIPIGLKPK